MREWPNIETDSVTSTPIAVTNGAMRSGMAEHSELFGVAMEISHTREGDTRGKSYGEKGQGRGSRLSHVVKNYLHGFAVRGCDCRRSYRI
jgi:hypothetical protein